MDVFNNLVTHLLTFTNGALLMTPLQFEKATGKSANEQSKLRSKDQFPIPYQRMGRSVVYSVYKVAEFMMEGEVKNQEFSVEELKSNTPSKTLKAAKAKSNVTDMSHLFRRSFANGLVVEGQQMVDLGNYLLKYIDNCDFKNRLDSSLTKEVDDKFFEKPKGKV